MDLRFGEFTKEEIQNKLKISKIILPIDKILQREKKIKEKEERRIQRKIQNILPQITIQNEPIGIQIRGMENRGNSCFVNSVMQGLLACPPFIFFLDKIRKANFEDYSNCLILQSLAGFIKNISVDIDIKTKGFSRLGFDFDSKSTSFFYEKLFDVIGRFKPDGPNYLKSVQEDAQEFLNFLLDSVHEEIAVILGLNNSGKMFEIEKALQDFKNTQILVQRIIPKKTIIRDIFGGTLKSKIVPNGMKPLISFEPFMILPININGFHISSIEDALIDFSDPENLRDYTDETTKQNIGAQKKTKIHQLPVILILHLKRFRFSEKTGAFKVHKAINFPTKLTIPKKIISSELHKKGKKEHIYNLVSVIYHIGQSPIEGHYTCSALKWTGNWVHIDDTSISEVSEKEIVDPNAYILFYIKTDK
ncbi:ubiquitin carboxyl-terminal hydrolase [Anaeramoeba ignava]|uniref:Ubiquitin carboxyl-terminal hydrolase n=1 Tax=Anaeramoeba ignava TaxID=1746090 RepID=A0A9Q0RCI7_ANAIG|nr:ubiquitin carboxyl-terminal hydrolase [Anaeramoeba ignava]